MIYTKMHFDDVSNFSYDVITFKMAANQLFTVSRRVVKAILLR